MSNEEITNFLGQVAVESHTTGDGSNKSPYSVPTPGEALKEVKMAVEASAHRSLMDFVAEIETNHKKPATEEDLEGRVHKGWGRIGRKAAEVVAPVALGVGTRVVVNESAKVLGIAAGPIVAAAAAAATGVVSGGVSAYIEANKMKVTGEGAKELYQKVNEKVLTESGKKEGLLRRVVGWYTNGLRRLGLEKGFNVEGRRNAIDEFIEGNLGLKLSEMYDSGKEVEFKKKFLEAIIAYDKEQPDVPATHVATFIQNLSVQAILSGFAETKTTKGMRNYSDLVILANLGMYQRIKNHLPNMTHEQIMVELGNQITNPVKREIAERVTKGKIFYTGAGAIDRAWKSVAYTLLIGQLIDSVKNLNDVSSTHIDANDVDANVDRLRTVVITENETPQLVAQVDLHPAVEMQGELANEIVKTKASIEDLQLQLAGIDAQISDLQAEQLISIDFTHDTFRDQVQELFGSDWREYMAGGGSGSGSRFDRLDVIFNLWNVLQENAELRSIVTEYAATNGWNEYDLWNSLVMRIQYYPGGGTEENIIKALYELQAGVPNPNVPGIFTNIGDINQGLRAAGDVSSDWHDLIRWAVDTGTQPSVDSVRVEIAQLEEAQNFVNGLISGEVEKLADLNGSLQQVATTVPGSMGDTVEIVNRIASVVEIEFRNIALEQKEALREFTRQGIETAVWGMATLGIGILMANEVFEDTRVLYGERTKSKYIRRRPTNPPGNGTNGVASTNTTAPNQRNGVSAPVGVKTSSRAIPVIATILANQLPFSNVPNGSNQMDRFTAVDRHRGPNLSSWRVVDDIDNKPLARRNLDNALGTDPGSFPASRLITADNLSIDGPKQLEVKITPDDLIVHGRDGMVAVNSTDPFEVLGINKKEYLILSKMGDPDGIAEEALRNIYLRSVNHVGQDGMPLMIASIKILADLKGITDQTVIDEKLENFRSSPLGGYTQSKSTGK